MISLRVIELVVRGGIIVANLTIYARDVMDLVWPRLARGFSEARFSRIRFFGRESLSAKEREREATTKIHYFTVRTYVEFRRETRSRIPRGIPRESNLHKTINKTRLISVLAVTDTERNVYCVVTLEISKSSCVDLSRNRWQSFTLSHSSKVEPYLDYVQISRVISDGRYTLIIHTILLHFS